MCIPLGQQPFHVAWARAECFFNVFPAGRMPCMDGSRESVKCQVVGGIARAPLWKQTHSWTKSSPKSQPLVGRMPTTITLTGNTINNVYVLGNQATCFALLFSLRGPQSLFSTMCCKVYMTYFGVPSVTTAFSYPPLTNVNAIQEPKVRLKYFSNSLANRLLWCFAEGIMY